MFDRATGQLLLAKPFIKKLNWAKEIGKDGRPVMNDIKEQANGESAWCAPESRAAPIDFIPV